MIKTKFILLATLALCACGNSFAQGLDTTKLAALKAATALILVEAGDDEGGSGSGFLFRKDGNVGFFATNAHVVAVSQGNKRRVKVILNAGIPNRERILAAQVIGEDEDRDLAVLRVESANLPEPLTSDNAPVGETTPVYVLGFPFGDELATGKLHSAISVTTGTVSSVRLNDDGNVKFVQIDADINPGNSGGPVVTAKGELVGIASEKIDGTGVGLARPTAELNALLVGRVAGVDINPQNSKIGTAKLTAKVRLIDPLEQVQQVGVLLIAQNAAPKPNFDEFPIKPLAATMQNTELKIENGLATGEIALESAGNETAPQVFWQQIHLKSADGTEKWTQPVALKVDFGGAIAENAGGAAAVKPNGDDWLGAAANGGANGAAPKASAADKTLLGTKSVLTGATASEIGLPAAQILPKMLFSGDGKHVFVVQNGRGLLEISVPDFREEKLLPFSETASGLAFSKAGIVVALPNSAQLWVVNPATLEVAKIIKVPGVEQLAASSGSDTAFVSYGEENLAPIDLRTGKVGQSYAASGFVTEVRDGNFREKVSVLENFNFPTLSPDGKFFYCESLDAVYRFTVNGNDLKLDEIGPEIGQNPQSIALSSDGNYIALLDGGGNIPPEGARDLGPYTTYVFKTGDLQKSVIALKSGAYPRQLAFDKVAGKIYTHNIGAPLLVFAPTGTLEREIKLPNAARGLNDVKAILAHPDGKRVLVLMDKGLFWFELE